MEIIDWQATLWAQFAILHQLILPHFFRSATLSSSHILSTTWQGLPWTCCNTTTMAISYFFRPTQPCHYCIRPSNLHSHSLLPLWPTIPDPATLTSLQLDLATPDLCAARTIICGYSYWFCTLHNVVRLVVLCSVKDYTLPTIHSGVPYICNICYAFFQDGILFSFSDVV
jgi:hypothetical protein